MVPTWPGDSQRFDFLAGAAKNHRVTTFQPDHSQARVGQSDHEKVDFVLLDQLLAATLPYAVQLSLWRNEFQNLWRNQIVVQHSISRPEKS